MAKHSRWSKVKHYKGTADAKRAAIFTRLGRAITVAAREGGGDPSFNFQLRSAIDQALAGNMPKDNIDRAVKKGTGEIASDRIEEIVYEGYGPGGVAVLVEALTDNRNRTSSNVKHAFSVHGGNLGATGAVQWMFDHKGIISIASGLNDEQQIVLIDAGAEDIETRSQEQGGVTAAATVILCAPDALGRVRAAAESSGLHVTDASFTWEAKDLLAADPVTRASLVELLEALDEDEDVSAVYTNRDI